MYYTLIKLIDEPLLLGLLLFIYLSKYGIGF